MKSNVNNQINNYEFKLHHDLPVIKEIPAYIRCKVLEVLENGDHPLFLSEVVDSVLLLDTQPLELRKTGWSYGG